MKELVSLAMLCLLFALTGTFAQENKSGESGNKPAQEEIKEKKITDAEFKAVLKKSTDLAAGKNYRLRKSSKTLRKSDESLSYYSNEVIEFEISGKSHSIIQSGSGDGTKTVIETIIIGQKAYTRTNQGSWQIGVAPVFANSQPIYSTIEHLYKGRITIDEMEFDFYESKYVSKTIKAGRDFVTTTFVQTWFDKNGLLRRKEEKIETNNTITKRVYEYEYDIELAIEAPTL